ncbi:tumor protein p53-inducible nuclear protein 2 [Poeciliopsis prolifica]|uniref:tumor protein p53-inducible nuclear protein 2 n=1 Tax=Poeciliopsis prolifica TaxID=188132 RepID=UPI0024136B22|nr:tumor protein p53-inducible nuclear protein 2 [Poeciliopsis prolifica]
MLRKIVRLLFGGEVERPEEVKPGDAAEDGWLVVNHQEAGGCEKQDALVAAAQQAQAASQGETPANAEKSSPSLVKPTVPPSRTVASYVSQPKAVAELSQVTCAQKAKARTDRRHASRNAMQRQNHVHQALQHNSFHLHQPGHRSLSH